WTRWSPPPEVLSTAEVSATFAGGFKKGALPGSERLRAEHRVRTGDLRLGKMNVGEVQPARYAASVDRLQDARAISIGAERKPGARRQLQAPYDCGPGTWSAFLNRGSPVQVRLSAPSRSGFCAAGCYAACDGHP